MNRELLRKLPKVDEVLLREDINELIEAHGRAIVVDSLREGIEFYRNKILKDEINSFEKEEVINYSLGIITKKSKPRLKRVINGAGIVIHTNLGRSLLSKEAVESMAMVSESYNNLEYDIEKGARGSRYSHIEDLLKKITGAEGAVVVNNNAAAVMLALNTLCEEKEAIVSRGQLVEIGGSFRVPEVMKFSKAKLVEVGTTNRTHLYDYEDNISENTGVLLKVHTSNFKIMGFTEEVPLEDMVSLGEKYNVPVVDDLGSGVLVDLSKYGFIYEPTVQESVRKGADVVTFSGDKMLGGPQAGIIVGKKEYIDRIKKNQLTRALRIDKMRIAALEATLRTYLDEKEAVKKVPTLSMMLLSTEELKKRAQRLKRKLKDAPNHLEVKISEDYSMVGGGSMPTETMDTVVLKIKSTKLSLVQIENYLRAYEIPIIVRVGKGEVIIDVRTLLEKDYDIIGEAFKGIGEE
ncbi:L-seryl-tRNA(Sec) selenium transferase [Clostridium hydrogeniformans]|uniref:L-seryl-tRNA(Sec) selenium transferase n=1 Tax=Clostridium hydrogeniformans TaxID=349933 RepID=UPI00048A1919|nr:L-seryl-tRNA(Sec) selenium transferase [Clostridium hydrogeniformans]